MPAALTVTTGTSSSKQEELRRRVGPVPHLGASSPYSNPSSEGDVSDASIASPTSTNPLTPLLGTDEEKRSGSLLRQQLLEIIQANMEKNNLSFHASRYESLLQKQFQFPKIDHQTIIQPLILSLQETNSSIRASSSTATHSSSSKSLLRGTSESLHRKMYTASSNASRAHRLSQTRTGATASSSQSSRFSAKIVCKISRYFWQYSQTPTTCQSRVPTQWTTRADTRGAQ